MASVIYVSKTGEFRVLLRDGVFVPQYFDHDLRAWRSFRNRITGGDVECSSLDEAKTYEKS